MTRKNKYSTFNKPTAASDPARTEVHPGGQSPAASHQPPTPNPHSSWYAIYCRSRNEKKVDALLRRDGIETYLPLLKSLKIWSDRKKWVEEPLFRSYLFVNISLREYQQVLQTDGVVRFVTFERKPVPVPEEQIMAIRQFLNLEDAPDLMSGKFEIGDRVEVFRGNLKGLVGNLVEWRGKQKVRIEIESIGQSIILTVPKSYLKVIPTPKTS